MVIHIQITKILLHVDIGILIYNDASLKTDTCNIPGSNIAAYIDGRCVIQMFPITYPSGNKNAGYYIVPFIAVSGYFLDGVFQATGSDVWMTKNGTLASGVYQDFDNLIICRYWYINI